MVAYKVAAAAVQMNPSRITGIRQARAADGRTWGPGDALSDPLLPAPVRLPGGPATAAVRGEAARTVVFDQEQPLDAQPVIDYSDPDSGDDYVATIRFIEV